MEFLQQPSPSSQAKIIISKHPRRKILICMMNTFDFPLRTLAHPSPNPLASKQSDFEPFDRHCATSWSSIICLCKTIGQSSCRITDGKRISTMKQNGSQYFRHPKPHLASPPRHRLPHISLHLSSKNLSHTNKTRESSKRQKQRLLKNQNSRGNLKEFLNRMKSFRTQHRRWRCEHGQGSGIRQRGNEEAWM